MYKVSRRIQLLRFVWLGRLREARVSTTLKEDMHIICGVFLSVEHGVPCCVRVHPEVPGFYLAAVSCSVYGMNVKL
jgi:hypothetical protein